MLETEKKLQHEKQRWNNMHACLQYINACMIESQALAFVGRAPAEELKAELGNRTSNETSYSYFKSDFKMQSCMVCKNGTPFAKDTSGHQGFEITSMHELFLFKTKTPES